MIDGPEERLVPTIVYGRDAQHLTVLAGRYLDDASRYAKRGYSEAATKGGISIDADRLALEIEKLGLEDNTEAELDLTTLQRWTLIIARGAEENSRLAASHRHRRILDAFSYFFQSLFRWKGE